MSGRIWKLPCRHCGHHIDVDIDEGVRLFDEAAVEVTEYVWDGTEFTASAIVNALHGAWEVDSCYPGWLDIWQMAPDDGEAFPWARLRPGWRIHIGGGTFSIHPPKDGDA